jgi:TRAP-type C4-dicarboxylate transport system permease small subunit
MSDDPKSEPPSSAPPGAGDPDAEQPAREAYDPVAAVEAAGGELRAEVAWTPNYPRIRALDAAWFRVEQAVCGVMFLGMALMVFLAVLTDIFGTRREWIDLVVLFGVCYIGVRTRAVKQGETRPDHLRSLAWAAGIAAAVAVLVYFYTERYPGGFVWAQKLALVVMLWVALLGASMATHERTHLSLEMGEKLWPRRVLHLINGIAHAVTSVFCLLMLWVSINMVVTTRELGQVIEANLWLPRWVALLIVPYAFLAMSVRLLAQTYAVTTRTSRPKDEELPT